MPNIFIDTDIILDLLAKREPHYIFAAQLFTLVDKKKIIAYTTPLVFSNIHYVLRKNTSREFALKSLRKLHSLIKILPVDEKIIELALNSEFKDFEDAIQYYTAISNDIGFLITRNKADYKKARTAIFTAEEYLKIFRANSNH